MAVDFNILSTGQKIYNVNKAICKLNAYLRQYALDHPGERHCRKLSLDEEIFIHDMLVNSNGSLNDELLKDVKSYDDLLHCVFNIWNDTDKLNAYKVGNRTKHLVENMTLDRIVDNYYQHDDYDKDNDDLEFDIGTFSEIKPNGAVLTNLYQVENDGSYKFNNENHRSLAINTEVTEETGSPTYEVRNIDIFGKDPYGNYWADYEGFNYEDMCISHHAASFKGLKYNVDKMLFMRHTGVYKLKRYYTKDDTWARYVDFISKNMYGSSYDLNVLSDKYDTPFNGEYENYIEHLVEDVGRPLAVRNKISLQHFVMVDDFMVDVLDQFGNENGYDSDYVKCVQEFSAHLRHCNDASVAAFEEMEKSHIEWTVDFNDDGESIVRYFKVNGKYDPSKLLVNSILNPCENANTCPLLGNQEIRTTIVNKRLLHSRTDSLYMYPDETIARRLVSLFLGDKVKLLTSEDNARYMSTYMNGNNKVEYAGANDITDMLDKKHKYSNVKSYHVSDKKRTVEEGDVLSTYSTKNLMSAIDDDSFDYGMQMFVGSYIDGTEDMNDQVMQIQFAGTQRSGGDVRYGKFVNLNKSSGLREGNNGRVDFVKFNYSYSRLKHSLDYTKDLLYYNVFNVFENLDIDIEHDRETFNKVVVNSTIDEEGNQYKLDEDIRNIDTSETYDMPVVAKLRDIFVDLYSLNGADDKEISANVEAYLENFKNIRTNSTYNDIKNAVELYNSLYNGDANKSSLICDLVGDADEFDFESFVNDLARTKDQGERIQKLEAFYEILTPYFVGYVPDDLCTVTGKNTYDFDTDKCYTDINGNVKFDVIINPAVLTMFGNGAINHNVTNKTIQSYNNMDVLIDDIQVLQTVGSRVHENADLDLPYDGINIVSTFVATDAKDIDADTSTVDDKVDFSNFNERIVVFDDGYDVDEATGEVKYHYTPMSEHESEFVQEMGAYIKEVLESRGRKVDDKDIVIDGHGIVRYKYNTTVRKLKSTTKKSYNQLSDLPEYEDFTYGYIGQIFVPQADGTIKTNYNVVDKKGIVSDFNDAVVLAPGYNAFIESGLGVIEQRMVCKGYKELLKDQIKQTLNQRCVVLENRGQLDNTCLNNVYRHLYSNTTPMAYADYQILETIANDVATNKETGFGYDDIKDFYADLMKTDDDGNPIIGFNDFVSKINGDLIPKVSYRDEEGHNVERWKFNKETIATKIWVLQHLLSMYRFPNSYREDSGLFDITSEINNLIIDDHCNDAYGKIRDNIAIYSLRDASYIDPTCSNTAYVQGLVGVFVMNSGHDENGYIMPSDKDYDKGIIFTLPIFKNFRFDGPDRTNMSIQNIVADGVILNDLGFIQLLCGGLTMDDGYVISKEMAKANLVVEHDPYTGDVVYNEDGSVKMRPLIVGDKIDSHGNKGTISAIVDRNADINDPKNKDIKWLILLFRLNKNVHIIGAPFPEVSRLTTATTREAFEEYLNANKDELKKYNVLVPDKNIFDDPEKLEQFYKDVKSAIDRNGNVVEGVDVANAETIIGLMSHATFTLTDKYADIKSHYYGLESEHGRSASGQLSFGLYSLRCDNILTAFYASSDSGFNKVKSYLELCGVGVNANGKFVNDIGVNLRNGKNSLDIMDMMPTEDNLKETYDFGGLGYELFKSHLTFAVEEFYKSNTYGSTRSYDFEKNFIKFLRENKRQYSDLIKEGKNDEATSYKTIADVCDIYLSCRDKMDIEVMNRMNDLNHCQYIKMPFDFEFKSKGRLVKTDDGGYLYPVLDAKYRSKVVNSEGSLIYDQFTNQYKDLVRALVSYNFWSMMDIDTHNMDVKDNPYIKQNFVSLNSHINCVDRLCHRIEDLAYNKFSGKRNLMKSVLYGNQIKNSATLVITADPSLKLNEMAMSFNDAKNLGIVPNMSDLFDKLGGTGVDNLIADIKDERLRASFKTKWNNYKRDKGNNDFTLTEDEFKALPETERMCMFWRDPLLQSCGIAGFSVVINDRLTGVAINPAIDKRFDADFDGDTGAIIGFYGQRKNERERRLSREAYKDVQHILSVSHTLINWGVTNDKDFESYFKNLNADEKAEDLYDTLKHDFVTDMKKQFKSKNAIEDYFNDGSQYKTYCGLSKAEIEDLFDSKFDEDKVFDAWFDHCSFNINDELDVAVGINVIKSDDPEKYQMMKKSLKLAKIDALRCHFMDQSKIYKNPYLQRTDLVNKSEKIASAANDRLSEYITTCLKESTGQFYMRNNTPQNHINDLVSEVINGYKGNFAKLKNVLEFTGYEFESSYEADVNKNFEFIKDYIDAAKDFNKGKCTKEKLDEVKARYDEVLNTVKINPLDFIEDYLKHPTDEQAKFRFNNMSTHFNSIAFATNIKTMGTGVAGKFLQRGMMLARCEGADVMDAVMRITYGATQGILQAKHDPEEARNKFNMIRYYLPALYRGQHIKMDEVTGKWELDKEADFDPETGERVLLTRDEFIDSYKKVCEAATGLKFDCHVCNIEKLADCIFDENGKFVKNIYDVFESNAFNDNVVDESYNTRVHKQIEGYSALDLAMYCEKPEKLFEFIGMSVMGDDLDWLRPIDTKFENDNKEEQTVCGLVAYNNEAFSDDEIQQLNSGHPIIRKCERKDKSSANRNVSIIQKMSLDDCELRDDGTVIYKSKDADGNVFIRQASVVVKDMKSNSVLISWDRNTVSEELNKISRKLYETDSNYKASYDALCSDARKQYGGAKGSKEEVLPQFYDTVNFGMKFCDNVNEGKLLLPQVYYSKDRDEFELTVRVGDVKLFGERNDLVMNGSHDYTKADIEKRFPRRRVRNGDGLVSTISTVKWTDELCEKMTTSTEKRVIMGQGLTEVDNYEFVNDSDFGILPRFMSDMYNRQYEMFTELCRSDQYQILSKDKVAEDVSKNVAKSKSKSATKVKDNKMLKSDKETRKNSGKKVIDGCNNEPESEEVEVPFDEDNKDGNGNVK